MPLHHNGIAWLVPLDYYYHPTTATPLTDAAGPKTIDIHFTYPQRSHFRLRFLVHILDALAVMDGLSFDTSSLHTNRRPSGSFWGYVLGAGGHWSENERITERKTRKYVYDDVRCNVRYRISNE